MVRADARPHVLRILPLRSGSEPDQVAEEDGDDLALLVHSGRLLLDERCRAKAAEGESVRILLAAARTCRHGSSLGRLAL